MQAKRLCYLFVLLVNCPVGTYFDLVSSDCRSCETGFYQDAEAQLSCKICPAQTSTAGMHARSVEECKRNFSVFQQLVWLV